MNEGKPNWYGMLEQRRHSVVLLLSLIVAVALAVTAMRTAVDYDAYWHLQMGKDWLLNGLSPWRDHYSFTYPGAEISGPPVAFQALLYLAVDTLGEYGGFLAVKLLAFLGTLALMLFWLRQVRAPVLIYCLVLPLLLVLLELRAHVRPELFSYALAIVAMMLYRRTALQLTVSALGPVALLLLVWVNYHSAVLGYVIFFGLFIDIAARLLREGAAPGDWLKWAAWGLLLVALGFVNPGMDHPVLQLLAFPSEWKQLIQEYQSPGLYVGVPAMYVLAALVLLTIALLLRQRKFGYLAITAVFLYAGLTMARMVTPGGIVLLCLFAHAASETGAWTRFRRQPGTTVRLAGLAALVAFLIPLLNGVQLARAYIQENSQSWRLFPNELVEHLLAGAEPGRIFNSYELGGFLAYRLPREFTLYVDGRTSILYPLEHYQTLLDARTHAESFAAEVERYDIDYAVLEAIPGIAGLMADAGFELDYVDAMYALYRRRDGNFAASGRLWAKPFCWGPEIAGQIEQEWTQAVFLFPPSAPVMPLLEQARVFAQAQETSDYVTEADAQSLLTDSEQRFLGYRALEAKRYEVAFDAFRRVLQKEPKDFLAAALALLRTGQAERAEGVLDEATRQNWQRLKFEDIQMLHALLEEIAARGALRHFDSAYLAQLADQVGQNSLTASGQQVSAASFCRDHPQEEQPPLPRERVGHGEWEASETFASAGVSVKR